MVDEGLAVVELTGDGDGLEDLFLRVTGRDWHHPPSFGEEVSE